MKNIFFTLTIIVFITSCKKEKDHFLVEKHNIGFLTDSTQVKDLNPFFRMIP